MTTIHPALPIGAIATPSTGTAGGTGSISAPSAGTAKAAQTINVPSSASAQAIGSLALPSVGSPLAQGAITAPTAIASGALPNIGVPSAITSGAIPAISAPTVGLPADHPSLQPRETFDYLFTSADSTYIDTGRRLIPDPLTDNFYVEFETGIGEIGSSKWVISQADSESATGSEFAIYTTGGGILNYAIGGAFQGLSGITLSENTKYRLEFTGNDYRILVDDTEQLTGTKTRGAVSSAINTIIGATDNGVGGHGRFYDGVLKNIKTGPLTGSSFDPAHFEIDDNNNVIGDKLGGTSAVLYNMKSSNWISSLRDAYFYEFSTVDGSYINANRRIISDPLTQDFSVEWSYGSSVAYRIIVNQTDGDIGQVSGSEFAIYDNLTTLEFVVGGTVHSTGQQAKPNAKFKLSLTGSAWELFIDGTSASTGTLTRGVTSSSSNTYIATVWTGSTGVLFDVTIEPLSGAAFDKVVYFIDDNSATIVDQEGGVAASMINYDANNWKSAP